MAFVTVIPQQSRAAGTYRSAGQAVGAAVREIDLRAVMSPADLADPTKSLSVLAERSFDGGATWRAYAQLDWTGFAGNARAPGLNIPGPAADGSPPFQARGTLVLPQTLSVGAEVQVT